jgi:hypothetical protein
MSAREEFLAGERLDDVLVYLSTDAVSDPSALADHAEAVPGGLVLVIPGEDARSVFRAAAGIDPMAFAQDAAGTEGDVASDLTGGTCPAAAEGGSGDHDVRFVFAFAEGENPDAGGRYAEGDVIHAYASCACGTAYSVTWVVGER